MPVSHIGLTVAHLPTSCSFFLSALQPLGYRYIGQQGNQIGLGIEEADFFLCQETAGVRAGAAHIAFSAPSRSAVRDFYTAALTAGGRPHGAPACRNEENGYFNAAILDFDGNSVEVVYREDRDEHALEVPERSQVLDWRHDVTESLDDTRTVVTQSSVRPSIKRAATTIAATAPVSVDDTTRSVPSPPPAGPPTELKRSNSDSFTAKRLIGTLIGAAAGAAVAYVMCKGEEEGARAEAMAYSASQASSQKSAHKQRLITNGDSPGQESPRRNISVTESIYESPAHRYEHVATRAIEAPPPPTSYHHTVAHTAAPTADFRSNYTYRYVDSPPDAPHPVYTAHRSHGSSGSSTAKPHRESAAPTLISSFVPSEAPRALPAPEQDSVSVSSHRSSKSRRSVSKESTKEASKAASRVSKAPTVETVKEASRAPSKAPSPSAEPIFDPSKPLFAPASRLTAILPSTKDLLQAIPTAPVKVSSKAPSKAPSNGLVTPPSKAPSKAPSVAHSAHSAHSKAPSLPPSVLGRSHVEPPTPPREREHSHHSVTVIREPPPTPPPEEHSPEPLELSDLDIDDATVAPSDSISQVGGSPNRHRRRRSPSRSHHSSHSKRSHRSSKDKESHVSSRSHHSSHSKPESRHSELKRSERRSSHDDEQKDQDKESVAGSKHSHRRSSHAEEAGSTTGSKHSHSHHSHHSHSHSHSPSKHSSSRVSATTSRPRIDTENVVTIIRERERKEKKGDSSDAGSESTVKPARKERERERDKERKGSVVSEARSLPWKGEERRDDARERERERGKRSVATFAG